MAVIGSLVIGCSSTSTSQAPVEDRRESMARSTVRMDPNTQAVSQPPGFENAGKPGFYTVKPGETLIRVGLETGQNWKDIQRWNNIDNPNQIEVGQVLRVIPPNAVMESQTGVVTRPVTSSSVAANPVVTAPSTGALKPAATASAGSSADEQVSWLWPVNGPVLAAFDEVKNKGLDLGGAAGEPVLAAADGRVVYAGAGLRGYGNLIILKHNNTYLTAYAHNKALLVKEDQSVRKGQKIAEMGNSDADRVKLHFEVRRQGKPVDPAKLLPAR
jgi:lipoprotein NlpD